jgi:hypothetical protein
VCNFVKYFYVSVTNCGMGPLLAPVEFWNNVWYRFYNANEGCGGHTKFLFNMPFDDNN